MRKSELMHELFGVTDGKCKECKHFKAANGGWSKCLIYGESASEATDWNRNYPACGLKDKELVPTKQVVKLVRSVKQTSETEGQMSLWEETI